MWCCFLPLSNLLCTFIFGFWQQGRRPNRSANGSLLAPYSQSFAILGLHSIMVQLALHLHFYCDSLNNFKCFFDSAEPLKKKKKMDPALVKARDERKKNRINKSIRMLQKNAQKLKPIEEMVVSKKFLKEVP
jgi:Mitochondrial ribosomal protein L28